jgi:hypothetical protein
LWNARDRDAKGEYNLVLGRFQESIPDDSILDFLRESEKTRAKSQEIDSGSLRIPNQNDQKKRAFQTKIDRKGIYKTHFFQLFHISLAEGPQIAFTPMPQQFLRKISEI